MIKRAFPVVGILLVVAGLVGMAVTMAFLQPSGSSGW